MSTPVQWRWAWLGLAVLMLGAGALAAQTTINLDKRYPAGSIDTEARAEQALTDAAPQSAGRK